MVDGRVIIGLNRIADAIVTASNAVSGLAFVVIVCTIIQCASR